MRPLALSITLVSMTHVLLPLPGWAESARSHSGIVTFAPGVRAARTANRSKPSAPGASAIAPVESLAPSPEEMVDSALKQTVFIEGDGIYGSGLFIVPRRGLVLTNWHVIEEIKTLHVRRFDGTTTGAKVIEVDRALDLALLEVPPIDAPPPTLGDAIDLRPAQTLYAIGSPRKLEFTVSRGIVSYVGRPMEGTRYIQTDLAINDGNSGGPVLTSSGEVVGIMSFILRRTQGLAFALPINYAIERFATRLPEFRRTAYLDRFREWKGH